MITRENYEEYFLLYGDNELPAAARLAVEEFVSANPDLREEWETLLQCRFHPSRLEVFPDKELLLQQDLLSYIDGELDEEGRRAVESFVATHPAKAVELQQLSMTVNHPDLSVTFPDKGSLYRSASRKTFLLPWMRAGIAAAVIGLAALLLLVVPHKEAVSPAAPTVAKKNTPAPVTPEAPSPLYSSGKVDQKVDPGQEKMTAKLEPPRRQGTRKTNAPAPAEKKADVAPRSQEPVRPANAVAITDNRASEAAVVAEIAPNAAEKTLIKPVTALLAVNIPREQSSFATQALLAEAQADETKQLADASPAGRSKLRGIFRKVSRTFGKTAERDSDGQKEVLISAFQVALK